MREFNINEIEFDKSKEIPQEKLLTGEYLKGIDKNNPMTPNAEVEEDEYMKFPDQTVVKTVGNPHIKGGIDVAIPDGTETISNFLKPNRKQIKEIEKKFDITVKDSDTYASIVDKYTKKIGLAKLNDEQEDMFKVLKAQSMDKTIPKATAEVNLEYLSGKIKQIEQKKQPLQQQRKDFFDFVFQMQEASKPAEEQKPGSFKMGGTQNAAFKAICEKHGLTEEQANQILKVGGYFVRGGEQDQKTDGENPTAVQELPFKTKDNLTEEDKQIIKDKWSNKTDDYINFVNSSIAIKNNAELKKDLWEQYKQDIESPQAYTGKSQERKEVFKKKYGKDLQTLSPDDVINELLSFEERNARLKAAGFDAAKTSQSTSGPEAVLNKEAIEKIKSDKSLADLDFSKGYRGQAAYIAYYNLLNGNQKYKDQKLAEMQYGVSDENIFGKQGQVSGIDNYNTNTTLGQRLGFNWQKFQTPKAPGTQQNPPLITEDKGKIEPDNNPKGTVIEDKVVVPPPPRGPRAYFMPDQSTLPPTPAEAVALGDIKLGRIDPVRIGIDQQLQEAEGQKQFVANQLEGMPETQKASALALILANSNKATNQAQTQANQVNAQNVASAELFNIGQSDKEAAYGVNNLLNYEQRTLLGKAKAEEMLRRFYDYNRQTNVNNFLETKKLNLLDNMFPQYSLDFSGGAVNFDPDNPDQQLLTESYLKAFNNIYGGK